MDENTAMVITLSILFGLIALVVIVRMVTQAMVERAKERTQQLRLRQGGEDE